jgi:hypothetical protein
MAISRLDMKRQLRNMGGIMSLQEPRQGYFLGKLVKKAKKAVKKVVKSPIGKIALLGAATLLFGGPGAALKGLGGLFGKSGGLGKLLGGIKNMGLGKQLGLIGGISGIGGLLAAKEA